MNVRIQEKPNCFRGGKICGSATKGLYGIKRNGRKKVREYIDKKWNGDVWKEGGVM